MVSTLPEPARPMFKLMVDMLAELDRQIAILDREIARRAKEDEAARRLMTIPGIGPVAATAILALAPSIETFRKGRDFAAWLGLAPRQHSNYRHLMALRAPGRRHMADIPVDRTLCRSDFPFARPARLWMRFARRSDAL